MRFTSKMAEILAQRSKSPSAEQLNSMNEYLNTIISSVHEGLSPATLRDTSPALTGPLKKSWNAQRICRRPSGRRNRSRPLLTEALRDASSIYEKERPVQKISPENPPSDLQ